MSVFHCVIYAPPLVFAVQVWEEVIDEIFDSVDHMEPWMSGNARGPSTAFCLVHRLFTLKPTVQEMRETITHRDSPFIRAVRWRLQLTFPLFGYFSVLLFKPHAITITCRWAFCTCGMLQIPRRCGAGVARTSKTMRCV
jgi:pre-mRNA-splicing factor 38B